MQADTPIPGINLTQDISQGEDDITQYFNPNGRQSFNEESLPMRQSVYFKENPAKITDFDVIKELGKGAFGEVKLYEHKLTKERFAIKALSMRHIREHDKERAILREKELLMSLDHPQMINLITTFKVSPIVFLGLIFII